MLRFAIVSFSRAAAGRPGRRSAPRGRRARRAREEAARRPGARQRERSAKIKSKIKKNLF